MAEAIKRRWHYSRHSKVIMTVSSIIEFLYIILGPVTLAMNIRLIDLDIVALISIMLIPHSSLALLNFIFLRLITAKQDLKERIVIRSNLIFCWEISTTVAIIFSIFAIACGNMIVDAIITVLFNLLPALVSYLLVFFSVSMKIKHHGN